jgi:hypothetical protein
MNVKDLANFENLSEIEINKEYQFKEGSIIFNFILDSIVDDGEYLFLAGTVSEEVKLKYGIPNFILQIIKKPFYYSGMPKIMPKDSYIYHA